MSPVSFLLIGFAMSTDAFAAAIGKGAAMRKPVFRDALRAGIIFGVIEAITPIIGWLLGRAALQTSVFTRRSREVAPEIRRLSADE